MTCVAYKDGQLACDTQVSSGLSYSYHVPKLLRIDERSCWIAMAGTVSDFKDFMAWFMDHEPADRKPEFKPDDGVNAIALFDDGSVRVYEDTAYIDHPGNTPIAVGSGAGPALGAMYAGKSAAEAVAICCLIDPATGGEVQSVVAGQKPARRRKRQPPRRAATVPGKSARRK